MEDATKKVTSDTRQTPAVDKVIHSDYTTSVDSLNELLTHRGFLSVLGSKQLLFTGDLDGVHRGGFSLVFDCANDTVVKLTSSRLLSGIPDNGVFLPDINISDANNDYNIACIKAHLEREGYSYTLLDDTHKVHLVAPFFVPLYKDDSANIYDYLIVINLPRYTKLEDRLTSFDEKEVLKMAADVLNCLDKVHAAGRRHWDIKPENIMYDEALDQYVLIDWGTSCNLSDNEVLRNVFCRASDQAGTLGFIDPLRVTENSTAPSTDLYSLGVVLSLLAHKCGFWSENTLSNFLNDVCSNDGGTYVTVSQIGKLPCLTEGICDSLPCSRTYKNIVAKSLSHEYKNANEMLNDINKVGVSKGTKVQTKPPKGVFSINAFLIVLITPVLLTLYTFLLSGKEGFSSNITGIDNTALSMVILVICTLLPLTGIISKNKGRSLTIQVDVPSILAGLVLFLAISLPAWYILDTLNIKSPLILNCFAFVMAVTTSKLIVGCQKKNILSTTLISGALSGFCMAIATTVCLSTQNLGAVFTVPYIEFMLYSTVLGLVLGAFVWYVSFLWRTRCKKSY
ncbi:MAG: hypothetical protein IKU84_06365 [Clostridia bacterium]|nr:hypothetical protein [Clostridia bacterium]